MWSGIDLYNFTIDQEIKYFQNVLSFVPVPSYPKKLDLFLVKECNKRINTHAQRPHDGFNSWGKLKVKHENVKFIYIINFTHLWNSLRPQKKEETTKNYLRFLSKNFSSLSRRSAWLVVIVEIILLDYLLAKISSWYFVVLYYLCFFLAWF